MDATIQAYIRSGVVRGRESTQVGPFLATFSRRSDNPYLNYAIPIDGATPSSADVAALIAAFRQRGRTPRLEYLTSVAPAVEPAVLAAGFVVEGRLPVMVRTPGSLQDFPMVRGIELVVPTSDADLLALITAQNEAYGEAAPGPNEVEARRANIAAGGLAVLARDVHTGEPAGGGIFDVPLAGIAEIAGIGVRAAFRRRGIARALTTRLAREAFTRGVTLVFLTPAHDVEARIYTRAGFVGAAEQLLISLPSR
jgi:ribosomal protein S18 acetylase RimI-like enzyme